MEQIHGLMWLSAILALVCFTIYLYYERRAESIEASVKDIENQILATSIYNEEEIGFIQYQIHQLINLAFNSKTRLLVEDLCRQFEAKFYIPVSPSR